MSGDRIDTWIERVRATLGIPDDVDSALVLEAARDAAHRIERRAAPLTTYLMGVAVGRGLDPRDAAAIVAAMPVPEEAT